MTIDTTFDVRLDAGGKDPDFASPTLKRYHLSLWSKALPSGEIFELSDARPGGYIRHQSALGDFWLSSDGVIPTYARYPALAQITGHLPAGAIEEFLRAAYTVGGFVLWPGNRIGGKWTINQARGCLRRISDRMDLTVEAIRRHYLGMPSPLGETLGRYADFFELFDDFRGYVDFWLLQDLVTDDYASVRFFLPFSDFQAPHVPGSLDAYLEYRSRTLEFIDARNRRIAAWCATGP